MQWKRTRETEGAKGSKNRGEKKKKNKYGKNERKRWGMGCVERKEKKWEISSFGVWEYHKERKEITKFNLKTPICTSNG